MFIATKINLADLVQIEQIGEKCLPIYYHLIDLIPMHYLQDHIMICVKQDDQIIGFCIAHYQDQKNRLHIKSIAVLSDFRRKGVAKIMLDNLKTRSAKILSLFVIENNFGAIKFYAHSGFKSLKRLPNYYQSLNKSAYYLVYKI